MFDKKCILFVTTILTLTKVSDSVQISSLADLGNIRVVCYYASWSAGRAGIGKFTPENIHPHLCTHLIYAFGGITKDITFKPFNEIADIEQGGYAKFAMLKSYNKDLKTMLALGGWNEGAVRFSSIAANATKRSIFIANSIEFLRKHNFDGLNLDWQFPYRKDRRSYASLIQELREGYENESRRTGRPRLLLTITLPTLKDHITRGYDVPELTKYVDWMNVLNYNYHTEFEPIVNHHTQLYGVDDNFDYELNANYTINSYLESGAEREKLVLGIPTYGRAYMLADPAMTDIGSNAAGPGLKGDQTNESGFLAYYEICKKIKDDGWIVKRPYPDAMGPYAYKDNQWVCYDDEHIMRKKSQYVAENKLGGIMFWLIEYDDFRGDCTGKPFPLIEAAKEALITASGYVIGNVNTSPSNSRNMKSRRRPTTTAAPIIENSIEISRQQKGRRRGTTIATPTKIQYTTPKPPPTPSYGIISSIRKTINPVSPLDTPKPSSKFNFDSTPNEDEYNAQRNTTGYDDNGNIIDGLEEFRVVCYYASWSAGRSGIGKFTPEDIDPQLCTHIIYAFGAITEDIIFKPLNDLLDIQQGGYEGFTGRKTYNNNLKTILSLGGWNEGAVKFATMAANATKRSIFVKNAINYLRQYNFDGFDLDWQFPFRKDRNSYSSLIQELREGFENESKLTGRPRLLLTITLHPLKDHISRGYDVPHLTKNVDWMNVLTYNFHTALEPFVGHHTKLYSEDGNLEDELNSNFTINSYLDAGADRSKLVLGIPTYGRSFNLTDPNMTDLGSQADGPGLPGDQTGEAGFLAYYEICTKIKDEGWMVIRPYPNSMGPIAYKGNQWVGYDDEYSIKKKAEYVVENQLGGVMFWVIEYDDFRGSCTEKQFPLIVAAKETLKNASRRVTPSRDQNTVINAEDETISTVMLPKRVQPPVVDLQNEDAVEVPENLDLGNIRVVCYYASWSAGRAGIGKFTPENIHPHLCTHLIYAFGGITKDITFKPFNEIADIEQGGYAKFAMLKSYNKDLKTMLALGGWNEGAVRFSSIAANATKRRVFIANSIEFLRKHNFDGLNLDWQFPYLKDRRSYASLIQELREGYENESRGSGRPRLLLTITLPTSKDHITKGYNIPELTKYVDWMNVLNYNYHNEFEPIVNHHTQLYGVNDNFDYELNANYTINSYLESGAEREKLVLGIPTYGRAYMLADPAMTDIGSNAAGPGLKGDQTNESGFLAYYEICKKIKDDGWIVKRPYPDAMGPYAYKDNQWVCYDDEYIMRKKSQYVAENKLGGIMFWLIEYDDFRGDCTGKPFPLIEAAKEALITATGYVVGNENTSPSNTRNMISRRRPTTTAAPTTENSIETSRQQKGRRRGTTIATPTEIQYTTPKPPPTPSYEMISPNEDSTVRNTTEYDDKRNMIDGLEEYRVVCYYASWSAGRSGIGKFTPEDIDPQLCTHIIYAFGAITEDIIFKPLNDLLDIQQSGYEGFTGRKTYNNNLKTILSLGGWNEGAVKFATMAANVTKRSIFVKNAINYLRQYNFDGFDLDWQFPFRKDRNSYSSLIQELREGFENESKLTGRPRLLLTITLHPLKDHISRGYDVPHLTKNVDWMNVLTYNFHTALEPFVGHHTKLYSEDGNLEDELNSNFTINSYLDAGAERSKLVLGIPTYGRSFNLTDPNMTDLGSQADGPGLAGDQTGEAGFLAYYEICTKIKDEGWMVIRPYPNSMGPIAYKGNQWVGYDDEYSIKKKAEYVVENQLGGVMFWVIEYDDFRGSCTEKQFPLIEAAKETLKNASRRVTPNRDQNTVINAEDETISTVMLPKRVQPPVDDQQNEDAVEVPENLDLGNIRVVCYYASWSASRAGIGKFTPENIHPHLCTHLIYAFGGITKDITFKPFNEIADIEQGGYAKFAMLKSYNKDLKTMLALGGWNEGAVRFSSIAANATKRSVFIANSIEFLRKHNFDGLNLDWQFPYLKDRRSYASLIQELREGYENESRGSGRPRLLLTITLPTSKDHITKGYNIPELTKYVDWMNVLNYNYHNEFEPIVNHHTQLYGVNDNFDYELNANYTINSYLESGAEREKLVLGIPTYGRAYMLADPAMTDIGSNAAGPGLKGDQTNESGFLAYYEICKKIKDDGWIVKRPYPDAMGPYAYKDNQWVCYDDEYIMRKKSQYVAENKLGGIMFWLIEYDDFRGDCTGKPFPLIEAAKEALITATGYVVGNENTSSSNTRNMISRRRPTTTAAPTTENSIETSRQQKGRRRGTTIATPTEIQYTTPKPPPTPSYEMLSPNEDSTELNTTEYDDKRNMIDGLKEYRVVCYYASWSAGRSGIGKFTPEDIDPQLCTHIIYAFGAITEDIIFKPLNDLLDIQQGGYEGFTGRKTYNNNLKTILSLGGWNEGAVKFATMAANATKRSIFVKNAINYLRQYNFDGFDLDWQFPFRKDRNSYSSLIQELREGFENESKLTGRPRLLLTITLHPLKDHISRGYDVPHLTKNVDWMNVLTYNFHTALEPFVGHHTKLYNEDGNLEDELNSNFTINSYLDAGAERSKLVLGIPTYGRSFNLTDPNMTDLGSQADGPGLAGDQTGEAGFLAYYEICTKIKDEGWMVIRPYPNSMGPIAYKGNQWVGYDDEYSIKKKAEYVVENQLGGVMFWVIEYDDFRGSCTEKQFPLIEAAKETLKNASRGATPNRDQNTVINAEDEKISTVMLPKRIQPPVDVQENEDTVPEIDDGKNLDINKIRVVCYYAAWGTKQSGMRKFTPENINPQLCTHLIYAFGDITKEITFKPTNETFDIQLGGYAKFTGLKAFNQDLKTMLSLGGWDEGTVEFAAIAANATKRSIFVLNAITYLRQHNFDGLDLDWQFPFRKDRRHYSSLIQELREGFENESKQTGRSRLLLSITIPTAMDHVYKGYDVPSLTKNVDWMNAMTFDYHTQNAPIVDHHTKLYGVDENSDYQRNVNDTMHIYLESGAQKSKLVLGIPTYGRSFKLMDPNRTDLGSPADGPGSPGDQTGEAGFLAYHEICTKIKNDGWIVKRPFPDAMGPYAYKDNQWVCYDDEDSIRKKTEYVLKNKLGGIMFWLIEYDDFLGNCVGKQFPLIEAAKETLITASGSITPNIIAVNEEHTKKSVFDEPSENVPKRTMEITTVLPTIIQHTNPPPPQPPILSSKIKPSRTNINRQYSNFPKNEPIFYSDNTATKIIGFNTGEYINTPSFTSINDKQNLEEAELRNLIQEAGGIARLRELLKNIKPPCRDLLRPRRIDVRFNDDTWQTNQEEPCIEAMLKDNIQPVAAIESAANLQGGVSKFLKTEESEKSKTVNIIFNIHL